MVDDELNEDELAEGFQIKTGTDDEEVEVDEVLDDPNTELFDKAFLKDDELFPAESAETGDAEEMFNLMYQEYDER